jgi:hypothetical protein
MSCQEQARRATDADVACVDASGVNYRIQEFQVDGTVTVASGPWTKSIPSSNTQLAAVTFKSTGDRWVMYANTEGRSVVNPIPVGLYYIGSKDKNRKCSRRPCCAGNVLSRQPCCA